MTQIAFPPSNASDTSRAAAKQVHLTAGSQAWNIVTVIAYRGGMTQAEIADVLGMLRSSVAGRVNQLCQAKLAKDGTLIRPPLLKDSGERREGPYGAMEAVYVLFSEVA